MSDIHSNIVALNAVLDDAHARGAIDRVWSLGDLIGYGPRPNECIGRLREYEHVGVAGNHDLGAIGRTELEVFNHDAAVCCRWNGEQLTPESRAYVEALPQTLTMREVTLVHASLRDPVWEYLVHEEAARASFTRLRTPHLAVGHSHLPVVFHETGGDRPVTAGRLRPDEPLVLDPATRTIFNPGSVGQPRDGDPRAAYTVYDTDVSTITLFRVEYDVPAVQRDMAAAGLPPRMAERLAYGF